jgi:hypothetical protein
MSRGRSRSKVGVRQRIWIGRQTGRDCSHLACCNEVQFFCMWISMAARVLFGKKREPTSLGLYLLPTGGTWQLDHPATGTTYGSWKISSHDSQTYSSGTDVFRARLLNQSQDRVGTSQPPKRSGKRKSRCVADCVTRARASVVMAGDFRRRSLQFHPPRRERLIPSWSKDMSGSAGMINAI